MPAPKPPPPHPPPTNRPRSAGIELQAIRPYYLDIPYQDDTSELKKIKSLCDAGFIGITFTVDNGYSLRATSDIAPGTPLVVYPGELMYSRQMSDDRKRWAMHVIDDIVVDGYPYDSQLRLGRYPLTHSASLINHSSTPNAIACRIIPNGLNECTPPLIIIRAGSKGIPTGEEVTIKYGSSLSSKLRHIIGPHLDPQFKALHLNGYVIYENALKTSDLLPCILDTGIYEGSGLPQSADAKMGNDIKRLMSREATNARWNVELRARLTTAFAASALMTSTDGVKKFCRMHAIMSSPTEGYDETATQWQAGDQDKHIDEKAEKMDALRNEDVPMSVIVAFMPNTRLRVLSRGVWRILVIQPGDVLFFRGDLCHHGVGYACMNVRVHCHLYPKFYTPSQPISIHACPYLA